MRYIFLFLFFAFSAHAVSWMDLEVNQRYALTQTLDLKLKQTQNKTLSLIKGERFKLKDILPLELPGAPLVLYIFDYKKCNNVNLKTDLEIIPVEETSPLVEIGAEVENCEFKIYIELKDLSSNSIFKQ